MQSAHQKSTHCFCFCNPPRRNFFFAPPWLQKQKPGHNARLSQLKPSAFTDIYSHLILRLQRMDIIVKFLHNVVIAELR